MKLLIIQEAGHHEKNRDFREALNFKRAFDRTHIDCVVWGKGFENFNIPFDDILKDVDVILLLENYELGNWIPDLSGYHQQKLFWSIDAHWNLDAHLITCAKHKIDKILSSTYGYKNAFAASGFKNFHWFPNAYPSDLIMPANAPKTVDVGFCGNMVNRKDWIFSLQRDANLKFDNFVIGQDMVQTISSYKIHWNRNVKDDINGRTFETLGCGTFLLTNNTDRLEDLFIIGEHFVTYDSMEDCLEKIKYYLSHENERKEIEIAGHEYAKIYHTYDHRAKELLDIINRK